MVPQLHRTFQRLGSIPVRARVAGQDMIVLLTDTLSGVCLGLPECTGQTGEQAWGPCLVECLLPELG